MTEIVLRYVPIVRVESYLDHGWILAGDGSGLGHHASWSALMRWAGAGDASEPLQSNMRPTPESVVPKPSDGDA